MTEVELSPSPHLPHRAWLCKAANGLFPLASSPRFTLLCYLIMCEFLRIPWELAPHSLYEISVRVVFLQIIMLQGQSKDILAVCTVS